MSIFSRLGDIINSNLNAMLERAEDPEKIARLIIQEMEDTLVEVRTSAARSIADKKTLKREVEELKRQAEEWETKAELAVEKGREDLARGALAQKRKLEQAAEIKANQLKIVKEAIEKAESDMNKLQDKLEEAKAKHKALMMRRQTAEGRIKMRGHVADTKIDDALARYAHVERKVDELEAQVDAYDLNNGRSLKSQFDEIEDKDKVEEELQALKKRMSNRTGGDKPAAASTPGEAG
ncbi:MULTISPECIES: phage shock protein PspA [Euryhalocaulis]|uniref:phage shock protein PspA n=1 Tax=Euryhalocaulis TaxID=1712422 RepID=UPI00039B9061|nr:MULTISPECIES: phage shock protein PspA [Euryhalocaulis]MBA4802862.1 phage shock protein PspA [Euryhalocaulis sp.]